MPMTNDGALFHAQNMLGEAVTYFDNSNAALGVGDDNTAFSVTQSVLQAEAGGSSSTRMGMDSGYPSRDPDSDGSDRTIRFQSTFDSGEGNHEWLEWGIFNDTTSSSGVMHNREVEDLGKKTNNIKRILQVDMQLVPA